MKIGPKYKICRRVGEKVFPKCQTTKFSISGSPKEFGVFGRRSRSRSGSEYGSQLLEKQKARYTYGVNERQFAIYVQRHRRQESLYRALESRLDNVVFRLGLTLSRAAARQAITHGHIMVNGRRVNIPSCAVRLGDKIGIRPSSRAKGLFRDLAERLKDYQPPTWLSPAAGAAGEGAVQAAPAIGETEMNVNFGAIIDFYSRV